MNRFFTSESVTEGHPDKLCDRIADAVLDACLAVDPAARVACEVTACTEMIHLMGQITCAAPIPAEEIVRSTLRRIGYTRAEYGIGCDSCRVLIDVDTQSPDIALGTNDAVGGAGDQGMMFGYACRETPELMPLPIVLAHRLARQLAEVRKSGLLPWLRPDGKAQVTVEYRDDRPARIDTVVLSAQHDPDIPVQQLRQELLRHVIRAALPDELSDADTRFFINPTGRFVIGGPAGDTGLTGRKIIVDTYGGYARHGGGAFSGKDPTKVDRSAAYAARYIAKNIVAAQLAERCEVQLAYAIGMAQPVSVLVDTFTTGCVPDDRIAAAVRDVFELTPVGIIRTLGLRRPIYTPLAAYGQIGRTDLSLPWEATDKADALRRSLHI